MERSLFLFSYLIAKTWFLFSHSSHPYPQPSEYVSPLIWLLNNPLPIPYCNPVIPIFPRQPRGSSTNPQVNHWLQRDSLKERCHLYSYACSGGVMTEATWLHVFLIPLSLNSFPGNLFHIFNPILSSGSSHDRIFMPVYYALGPLPRPWECLLSCLPFISNSTLHLSSQWSIHSQSSYNHVSKIVLIQSPFLIFGTPNGYFLVFNFLDTADHSLYIDPPPPFLLCHKPFCLVISLLLCQMLPRCFVCQFLILCLLLKHWDFALLSSHILSLKRSHLFHGFISHLHAEHAHIFISHSIVSLEF